MTDVTPEYLLNAVDEETALKIWENLEGMRIYFSKNTPKHYKIRKDYKLMINRYTTRPEAIKQLCSKYELSESQIRKIIKEENKKLFDVD